MMNSRPTKKPETRGPFKSLRKSIGRILSSNAFLLIVSFLTALLTWGVLVASDGTLMREKTLNNVSVSVSGETALRTRGYVVMDDIKALLPGIKMNVEVTQSNYSRVTGASFNPHIDLTDVTGVGENELQVSFGTTAYGRVLSCEPKSITVNVDRYITRRVPVLLLTHGQIPDGLYMDSAKSDPSSLSISGPQSIVSTIARVVARADLSQMSAERMSDRISVPIELQTTSGEVIVSDKVQVTNQSVITDTVIVEVELLPIREIPLALDAFVTGEPAQGYELYAVEPAQTHLSVSAKQEVLDALEYLTTDNPLNISGATQDVAGMIRLKRPTGIENGVPYDVSVTAKIREKVIERTFRSVNVEVMGVDEAMSATLDKKQQTVQLSGGYGFISALEKDEIRLFVDAAGLAPGEYTLPVQIDIDNAPEFSCALSAPEILVTISEKP
ncbi:MAG: hypothetical protein IKU34_07230 [Clostridia bacterium]|nr:hypothetical protein [Clostridia bacterium]